MFTKVPVVATCEDNAFPQGTAEEVVTYFQRFDRMRVETEPGPPIAYASTEILTLQFPTKPDLADVNTNPGRQFADLVQCILGHSGLTRLLWGTVVEAPNICKLLLDWQTMSAYNALHFSKSFLEVLGSLEAACQATSHSQCFDLEHVQARRACFQSGSSLVKSITAFYFWQFSTPIRDYELVTTSTNDGQDSQAPVARPFPVHWTNYALNVYRRHKKSWGGGWLIPDLATTDQKDQLSLNEPDIYCGIIGARTVKTSKAILDEAENLPYEDGGIAELVKMTDGGLQVFHVGFTNLDQGWQGSVTRDSLVCHRFDSCYDSLFQRNDSDPPRSNIPSGLFGRRGSSFGHGHHSVTLADGSAKASESFCGLNGSGTCWEAS